MRATVTLNGLMIKVFLSFFRVMIFKVYILQVQKIVAKVA